MRTRRIINGDYSFGNGQSDIIDGVNAITQTCKTRLMQLAGEWFLDYRDGTRWGDVLGHKADTGELLILIKEVLLSVEGVTEITSINTDLDNRFVYLTVKMKTVSGDINLNQTLNALEILANDETNK